ncbi:hypothetical protein C5C07_17355 [Haloferax sp. Atlit-4N]|uniref:sulfatase family protein n=1 Tax=Haloferax sp. Atlit-4N TaxID=2077206 RepID=UPI000E225939|nr:sulfatase [Haloferax sp. Atlit-4N]RDZ51347.1 hypothetical protein C5C07_17355 [Haloferax sp. Atlit-4N]
MQSLRNQSVVDRPNVLLLSCHDLGRHLGCYDRGVRTPNVDSLAEDGVLLENHFCTAPQCCPSRGSLHTGRHPHVNGLMGQTTWGWDLNEGEVTIAEHLSSAGYSTHHFGVQHFCQDASRRYDQVRDQTLADELVEIIETDLPEMAEHTPFFASIGFEEPHLRPGEDVPSTFAYPSLNDDLFDSYVPDDVDPFPYLPDRPGVREGIANLNALITHSLDEAVGQILDQLEATGLANNTLVIFTADHGLAVPRAKGTGYDPGLEVAFVARLPGVLDGGERYSSLTSHVDVLPTVLDLLDLPIPDDLDGRSFRNLLGEERYTPRKYVRAEMTWHERYVPMRVVRTKDFKYIRNFWKQQRIHLPADIFGSPAGREFREEYYTTERPREELYDLSEDPHEQDNLAASRVPLSPPGSDGMFDSPGTGVEPDPAYADDIQRLRQYVYDRMHESNDPLLDGPVSRPGVDVWEDNEVTRT